MPYANVHHYLTSVYQFRHIVYLVIVMVRFAFFKFISVHVIMSHYGGGKTTMVWPRQKDARGENTEINYGLDTAGEKEKRTSKKNVDGRSDKQP